MILTARNKKQYGFTLLEVLISITLTALVLGNIIALQSQSKRLNLKAQNNLKKVIDQRAYLNAAWISNRQLDSYMEKLSRDSSFSIDNKKEIKKAEEQTRPVKFYLESFDIVNKDDDVLFSSVRIRETDVAKQ